MSSKATAAIAASTTCLCLTIAILAGLGDGVVYTIAVLALVSVGGLIYLSRSAGN